MTEAIETPEEKARRLGVPVIGPYSPPPQNDVVAICGACGMEMRRLMGFSCGRINCPTQMKVMS